MCNSLVLDMRMKYLMKESQSKNQECVEKREKKLVLLKKRTNPFTWDNRQKVDKTIQDVINAWVPRSRHLTVNDGSFADNV